MSVIITRHAQGGVLTRWGRTPDVDPPPPEEPTERFPGDPNPLESGRIYYGQSRQNNGSVADHESATGFVMPIRRRFFSSLAEIAVPNGGFFQAVREDHTAGRLPFVSFKLPDWQTAINGGYNSQIDAMIDELESYAKPTWVICNHEPENDGGANTAARWRGMQAHIRSRMTLHGTINRMSFGSCLMAYTWQQGSGRNPEDWWAGAGVHDWVAADHYTRPTGHPVRPQWTNFEDWCVGKGVPYAVGEWALHQDDDPNIATKMQEFYNHLTSGTRDAVAMSYFESNVGGEDFNLTNTYGALTKHRQLLVHERTIRLSDLGY
jgi:hypothetical protein